MVFSLVPSGPASFSTLTLSIPWPPLPPDREESSRDGCQQCLFYLCFSICFKGVLSGSFWPVSCLSGSPVPSPVIGLISPGFLLHAPPFNSMTPACFSCVFALFCNCFPSAFCSAWFLPHPPSLDCPCPPLPLGRGRPPPVAAEYAWFSLVFQ